MSPASASSPASANDDNNAAFFLSAVSRLFGWVYFAAWSVSFYPQPLLNWRRRSTAGLLIDFPFANVLGFLFYTLSTCMLFYSPSVRAEYARRNPHAPTPTVQPNDVAFAVHALAICVITLSQFSAPLWGFAQGPNRLTRGVLGLCLGCVVVVVWTAVMAATSSSPLSPSAAISSDGSGVVGGSGGGYWSWLDVVYALGYGKLAITVAKYVPQAWANHRRRSTVGWSIGQVLLDFVGGVLSIAQLLIDSSFQGDWSGVTGNPVKFGLGNVSIAMDVVFMLQHYVLYPQKKVEPELGEREALLTRSDEHSRLD